MKDNVEADGWITFDHIEIDLAGRRLYVHGIEAALEPKGFAVLSFLAERPGRVFPRDEILDAVWGHRHITPGVLNRIITLLRQALGESGADSQYLHTVHGVGYRFDAIVQRTSQRAGVSADLPIDTVAAPAANTSDSDSPLATAHGNVIPLMTHVRETNAAAQTQAPERSANLPVTSELVAESEIAAVAPETQLGRRTSDRPPKFRWIALAVIALLAIVGALAFVGLTRSPQSTSNVDPMLVVLPLRSVGGGDSAFAAGLSEELTTQLARVEGLRVISSMSADRAQQAGYDAAQLAQSLHVTHALEGSLQQAGDQLRIDLRLIETPSGHALWAQNYDRKVSDVFAMQQEIAQAVATALALRLKLTNAPLAKPPDPGVFRDYLAARHAFLTQTDDDANDKEEATLRALVLRAPDFAPARGFLADNLASDFEGEGKEDEALREARKTLEIDPNDFGAHVALAKIAEHAHDWPTVKREFDIALAMNPSDSITHYSVGQWLARLGYGEAARAQFEIDYASNPLGYWVNYSLGTQLDVLGRHDEAKRHLDMLPAFESEQMTAMGSMITAMARWRNAVWRQDFSSARAIAAHMPNDDSRANVYMAVTEALVDPARWPQAEAAIAALTIKADAQDPAYKYLQLNAHRLQLHAPKFDAAPILADFEPGDQQPDGGMAWTIGYATLHRDPAFSDFVRRMKFIDYWNANGWPPQCKPDGDGARCN